MRYWSTTNERDKYPVHINYSLLIILKTSTITVQIWWQTPLNPIDATFEVKLRLAYRMWCTCRGECTTDATQSNSESFGVKKVWTMLSPITTTQFPTFQIKTSFEEAELSNSGLIIVWRTNNIKTINSVNLLIILAPLYTYVYMMLLTFQAIDKVKYLGVNIYF